MRPQKLSFEMLINAFVYSHWLEITERSPVQAKLPLMHLPVKRVWVGNNTYKPTSATSGSKRQTTLDLQRLSPRLFVKYHRRQLRGLRSLSS